MSSSRIPIVDLIGSLRALAARRPQTPAAREELINDCIALNIAIGLDAQLAEVVPPRFRRLLAEASVRFIGPDDGITPLGEFASFVAARELAFAALAHQGAGVAFNGEATRPHPPAALPFNRLATNHRARLERNYVDGVGTVERWRIDFTDGRAYTCRRIIIAIADAMRRSTVALDQSVAPPADYRASLDAEFDASDLESTTIMCSLHSAQTAIAFFADGREAARQAAHDMVSAFDSRVRTF